MKPWKAALLLMFLSLTPLLVKAQATAGVGEQEVFRPHLQHEVQYGNLFGNDGQEVQNGVSLQYIGTYRINPYLAIGAGLGAQTYRFNSGYSYFPFWAVFKGYIPAAGRVRPFGQIALGYGLALNRKEEDLLLVDARGGFNANSAVGIEIPVHEELGLLISLGYQYQAAESTYDIANWWLTDSKEIQQLRFRRIHLQLGVKF
ncbi:MAG: hypothetical protein RIC19_03125 [Phaeodactylibacter sp.]|uniref:outer membrane beta-barrel protein n=1 Tax=Phaeodactylibacter sp. TaxID=1940289 RepID=UPI0032EC60A7